MAQELQRSVTDQVGTGGIASDGSVLEVRGLEKAFGSREILRGLDLELKEHEFVALLGRSGGGKSTFLRILQGLDTEYTGSVLVPTERSVVFQEPRLLPWAKTWQNVVLGLRDTPRALEELAARMLAEVGLEDHGDTWPETLSGGEAQRAGLARALVRKPKLLLLDEPFAALDALTKIRMHELLRELVGRYRPGVVLVTHDVREAIQLADRVLVLDQGRFILDHRALHSTDPTERAAEDEELRLRILGALGVPQTG